MFDSLKDKKLFIVCSTSLILVLAMAYVIWMLNSKVEQLKSEQASNVPLASQQLPSLLPNDAFPDPFSKLHQNMADIDDWMEDMQKKMFSHQGLVNNSVFTGSFNGPDIQFENNDSEYRVTVTLPEGQEVELNTELTGGVLSLSGKVQSANTNDTKNVYAQAWSSSQFSRTFMLDEPINDSEMEVYSEGNITVVVVPKLVS